VGPDEQIEPVPKGQTLGRPFDKKLLDELREALADDVSQASLRSYDGDFERYRSFCSLHAVPSLPTDEQTLCLYILDMRANGLKLSTIKKAIAGIKYHHAKVERPLELLPKVSALLSKLGREMVTEPKRKKPLLPEHLHQIAAGMRKENLRDTRDMAILLVGWAAALRISEIAALNYENIEFVPQGMIITLVRRKNAQRSESRVAVPKQNDEICPVRALRAWLEASEVSSGALFRAVLGSNSDLVQPGHLTGETISEMLQKHAGKLGFNPFEYGGHSMRAGLATSAARAGVSIDRIMRTTGHKSIQVALGYIRNADEFNGAASGGLLEQPDLREKAIKLHKERGASPEVIAKAFAKAGVDVPIGEIERWIKSRTT
jgi:integrase